jgi:elongation factor 1-beta
MALKAEDAAKKVAELNDKLKGGKLFIEGGNRPSAADVKAFNELLGAGNGNLFRWVKNMSSFSAAERKGWGEPLKARAVTAKGATDKPAAAAAAKPTEAKKDAAPKATPAATSATATAPAPKPAEKKPAAATDDDDLFGEETEEEKAALEAKKKKDAENAKPKKTVIAKSSILVDIKPWDDETNMKELAAKLITVQKDGLLWGAQKFVPVAYGLNKLQQLLVIEDDKVSGDDLEDLIMGFEEYVQSMDIVAWNKV